MFTYVCQASNCLSSFCPEAEPVIGHRKDFMVIECCIGRKPDLGCGGYVKKRVDNKDVCRQAVGM